MAFKIIETQEQFDAAISERIKRERDTVAKQYEGYISPADLEKVKADLKAGHDKQIADLNKAMTDLKQKYADYDKNMADKDAKIKGYETASVKTRIAHEMGLSYEAVDFLKGEDEASIKKSAESLKAIIGDTHEAPPLANPEGNPGVNPLDAALNGMLQTLNGGK